MKSLVCHIVTATVIFALWNAAPTLELKSKTYEEFAEIDENRTYPPTDKTFQRKLIVTTLLELPYMNLKKGGVFLAGKARFEGFLADLLAKLAESVGFDYEIKLVQDGRQGGRGENGTWSGMVGELYRGEADLAASPLTINQEHVEAVDFTEPFMTLRSAAIIQKPRRRGRQQRKSRMRSVTDLLQSDYQYGVISGSHTEELFRLSFDSVYQALWSRMNTFWPSAFVQSAQEGVQRVRHEKFAFILDLPMAEYLAGRKPCDLYVTEPFLNTREYALAMKKGDPMKLQIDQEIVRLRISGEMETIYRKWWTDDCNNKRAAKRDKNNLDTSTPITPWRFGTAEGYNEVNRSSNARKNTGTRICVALSVSIIALMQLFGRHGHPIDGNYTRKGT